MVLQLTPTAAHTFSPEIDRKGKDVIARKGGKKHVRGDVYKERTFWKKTCDFVGASRAVSVMAKSHFESKQHIQAAILRKNREVELRTSAGETLTEEDYDAAVWNSNGVQQRIMREDHIRYNPTHFTAAKGASKRNIWARRFSRAAHFLHGLCEMNAAPTGMTTNVARNLAASKVDDKSTTNKFFMAGTLGFIGVATFEMLDAIKKNVSEAAMVAGYAAGSLFVAFPAFSGALGIAGTALGVVSQLIVEKQKLSTDQKTDLAADLSSNLQKLVWRLKSVKGNPELVKMMANGMQGRHAMKKIGDAHLNKGIPTILENALESIDPAKSDLENMEALKSTLGDYLHVEKPQGEARTWWSRYKFARAVTGKERHFVALVSLVDHLEIHNPEDKYLQDLRKNFEDKQIPALHDLILRAIAYPASLIDFVAKTRIAPTLRKWADPDYQKKQAAKIADPRYAARNCYKGEYMAKNIHQYGPVTRGLIKLAEGMRLFNMNIVLASNANLSRLYNNAAQEIHNRFGTSPASRSMCHSIGRAFGGATLALIFGLGVPALEGASGAGSKYNIDLPGGQDATLSASNVGILMFLLAAPTFVAQGIAELAARIEGWNGNIQKSIPSKGKYVVFKN